MSKEKHEVVFYYRLKHCLFRSYFNNINNNINDNKINLAVLKLKPK